MAETALNDDLLDTLQDHWRTAGAGIVKRQDSATWELADWIYEGHDQLKITYDEIENITQKPRQSIYNKARVARAWPKSRRRYTGLLWSHYEATANLPLEWQHDLMDRAVREKISANGLAEMAKKVRQALGLSTGGGSGARFTGEGTLTLHGEYGLQIDIDPETLNAPPGALAGKRVKITIEEIAI